LLVAFATGIVYTYAVHSSERRRTDSARGRSGRAKEGAPAIAWNPVGFQQEMLCMPLG